MAKEQESVKLVISNQCLIHGKVKKRGTAISVPENDAKILQGSGKAVLADSDDAKEILAAVKKESKAADKKPAE